MYVGINLIFPSLSWSQRLRTGSCVCSQVCMCVSACSGGYASMCLNVHVCVYTSMCKVYACAAREHMGGVSICMCG